MKWDYEIELTVDTNDADYIHESYGIGTYDDDNEVDQRALAAEVLVYQNFEVDDGESDFDLDNYLEDLHKFGLKPSDRCEEWRKYDYIMEYLYGDNNTKNPDDDMEEWKEEVEEEIGDCLPHMDNCWNNHSFSYELTRRPAGTREESCEYNYDAESYKDILTFEDLNSDDDFDEFDEDEESEEEEV
ncbi:MAG: hypothetical protein IJH65_08190 [Methanobrevibacter sp.]|nr:hypothetical protein [Methanobrevibacter sp.]